MNWISTIMILIVLNAVNPLAAQWSTDATLNTPVSTGLEDRNSVAGAYSGNDAFITAWQDGRNGGSGNYDIYVQKLDRLGAALWTTDGSAICMAAGSQQAPTIASDDRGGAIIVWEDSRVFNDIDMYAQRIDAAGNVRWTIDGNAICTASGVQRNSAVVADGNGGAIITWQDSRAGGSEIDIYAQRVDSLGAVQWGTDGVAVCVVAGRQLSPQMIADGAGGAIIVWEDQRVAGSADIYAQRINQNGGTQWASGGVAVCTAANFQESPRIAPADPDGALVTWVDLRNDTSFTNTDIYAQKIAGSGAAQWQNDGVAVCIDTESQYTPGLVSDGAGGAIITWDDNRMVDLNVYVQRISAQGQAMWMADGIQVTNISRSQDEPVIIPDGQGGAILAWEDRRNNNFDVFAQRIDPSGNAMWPANGVAISTSTGSQRFMSMVSDSHGGAYIAWEDRRTSGNRDDVYAQQVNANGQIGVVLTGIGGEAGRAETFFLAQNYPNPFNPATTIRFALSATATVRLEIFDVMGRRIAGAYGATPLPAGWHQYAWAGTDENGQPVVSGVYLYRLQAGSYVQTKKMILLR